MIIIQGLRTKGGMNSREHWSARAKRVRKERYAVWQFTQACTRPEPPLRVTLTRVAPSSGVDDDNLASALKSVRDQIADWLGVDDKHRDIVRYEYEQRRGPWAVEISWRPLQDTAQVR